jgi:hypothetical protein
MSSVSATKGVPALADVEYQPLSDCGAPRATAWGASGCTQVLSWCQTATALVWLAASLQMLAVCYYAWPLLPAPFATAMCMTASCAALCGIVAPLIELFWHPTAAESGETVLHTVCKLC